MGITVCRIRAASTTISFGDGVELTIPRRYGEPPEKTASSVARLLVVDRFDYALALCLEGPRLGQANFLPPPPAAPN